MASDTLLLLAPGEDVALAAGYLDWGPVAPASSADLTFRVANDSALYTAGAVHVSVADTDTLAVPSVAAQHLLSTDGNTFTAVLALGDLPPGMATGLLWLRRVTAAAAQPGSFTFTVVATATTWQ